MLTGLRPHSGACPPSQLVGNVGQRQGQCTPPAAWPDAAQRAVTGRPDHRPAMAPTGTSCSRPRAVHAVRVLPRSLPPQRHSARRGSVTLGQQAAAVDGLWLRTHPGPPTAAVTRAASPGTAGAGGAQSAGLRCGHTEAMCAASALPASAARAAPLAVPVARGGPAPRGHGPPALPQPAATSCAPKGPWVARTIGRPHQTGRT